MRVHPTLQTERLTLRPFNDNDAAAIYALMSNPRVMRYWNSPAWTDESRAEQFLAKSYAMSDEGSSFRFAIEQQSDGAFIGWCVFADWNPTYKSADIGYILDDAVWGHGYATEAITALLNWAYDNFDLNRVKADLDTRNPASAHVLEKLGFQLEGTLREDCIVNGEVSDSFVYGLLRREWEARRATTGA